MDLPNLTKTLLGTMKMKPVLNSLAQIQRTLLKVLRLFNLDFVENSK